MAKVKELYTIIVTNYNTNDEYIKTSLDSVFVQDYPNIQLIITDDGSNNINKSHIKKYITQNKGKNIKKVDYIFHDTNIGTVKILNEALKKSLGDYILFFASDDKLATKTVISNFYNEFIKNSNINVVTAQWKNCDEDLNIISDYVNKKRSLKYNHSTIKKQYFKMCCSNLYGSGATSYRKLTFERYGFFNEKYFLLEDWPYWLHLISNNEKIYYADFDGLLHRNGGVSKIVTPARGKFYNEILTTFSDEIMPNLNEFNLMKKIKILDSYNFHINEYSYAIDTKFYKDNLYSVINSNKVLKYLWYINKITPHIGIKIEILLKYNKVIPITVISTIILDFIVVNIIDFSSNNRLFLVCILLYIIQYWIVNTINNTYQIIKRKKK